LPQGLLQALGPLLADHLHTLRNSAKNTLSFAGMTFQNLYDLRSLCIANPPGNRGNIALAFQIWHRIVLTAMRVRNPELIELFKSSSVWPDWRIEIVSLQTSFLGAQM